MTALTLELANIPGKLVQGPNSEMRVHIVLSGKQKTACGLKVGSRWKEVEEGEPCHNCLRVLGIERRPYSSGSEAIEDIEKPPISRWEFEYLVDKWAEQQGLEPVFHRL